MLKKLFGKTNRYKFSKSVLPCLLLTLSIGFCYAFSLFSSQMAESLECQKSTIQFAFCLNIFFLGMGAAFFGNLVERHIKGAAFVSSVLLTVGLFVTQLGINCRSLASVYVGFGICCGIAEGCGYVVPVKNLLLWWNKSKNKALVSAISIISFGLGSTLCSILYKFLWPHLGIEYIFAALGAIYILFTGTATILINKPKWALRKLKTSPKFKCFTLLKSIEFIQIWLFMFLNISMGLILIGSCTNILKDVNFKYIILCMALCGIFNGGGRLVFPALSDALQKYGRTMIWVIVLLIEVFVSAAGFMLYGQVVVPIMVLVINATYGAGFATLPAVLLERYGLKNLSQIHGFTLSAWGMASLFAYLCSTFAIGSSENYTSILKILSIVYLFNLVNVLKLYRTKV